MLAYRALEGRFKQLADLTGALAILNWDRQAMMPAGGNGVRADQIATLEQIAHERLTSAETGALLDQAEQAAEQEGDALDAWQAANLREMRRSYRHAPPFRRRWSRRSRAPPPMPSWSGRKRAPKLIFPCC